MNLDSILEEVLHILVLRPLQDHLSKLFRLDFERSGCLPLLAGQMEKVRLETQKTESRFSELLAADFPNLNFPEVVEGCRESFRKLEAAFSPADKLTNLLTALKQIVQLVSSKFTLVKNYIEQT